MAQTTSVDLAPIIPEVWADMLEADLPNKIRFAPLATVDTNLEGQPGNKIKMNWWNYIGDAADIAETDVIVPTKMDSDGEEMTIKEAAKGVELTDKARLYPIGNPEAEARRQLVSSVAQKIDSDIITALASAGAGLVDRSGVTGTDYAFSIANMLKAVGEFGELDEGEWGDAFAGMVIRPADQIAVTGDPNFLSRDKAGDDATLFKGAIGSAYGIPFIVSNRATVTGPLLVRKNAVVLAYKRRPLVETDRDILARSTVITSNVHYGVFRPNRRKAVVKFKTA